MSEYTPTAIGNQALDAIGWADTLGDIEDGSHHAQILLRAYRQCLMQLLRAANWNFARKSAPMTLLADASGQTPYVGTLVPVPGFMYEYAFPTDCMKARYVPWNWQNQGTGAPAGNIQIPATPLSPGLGQLPGMGGRIRPAKFLISSDFNYPPAPGQLSWQVQGVSPQSRTVVLTNVQNAELVYTALVLYPSVWEPLFRAAMVAYLASEVALPIWAKTDRKFGLVIRGEQIAILRSKIMEARIADGVGGNQVSDISVDWMRTRQVGGTWARGWGPGGADGPGVWGYASDGLVLADGAVF